jgi:hypothetical protein
VELSNALETKTLLERWKVEVLMKKHWAKWGSQDAEMRMLAEWEDNGENVPTGLFSQANSRFPSRFFFAYFQHSESGLDFRLGFSVTYRLRGPNAQ